MNTTFISLHVFQIKSDFVLMQLIQAKSLITTIQSSLQGRYQIALKEKNALNQMEINEYMNMLNNAPSPYFFMGNVFMERQLYDFLKSLEFCANYFRELTKERWELPNEDVFNQALLSQAQWLEDFRNTLANEFAAMLQEISSSPLEGETNE